jgi:hypothetical protein
MAETTGLADLFEDRGTSRDCRDPQPGKYADDAAFGFILLSGSAFFASVISLLLDDQDSGVFFLLTASYFSLLYIALDPR